MKHEEGKRGLSPNAWMNPIVRPRWLLHAGLRFHMAISHGWVMMDEVSLSLLKIQPAHEWIQFVLVVTRDRFAAFTSSQSYSVSKFPQRDR
jgi:succinate dehydrogenase hydrophobic anchor subunit